MILRQLVPQKTQQISMIGEHMRLGVRLRTAALTASICIRARRRAIPSSPRRTAARVARRRRIGRISLPMHARHIPVRRTPRVRWHQFRRLNLDAMNRPIGPSVATSAWLIAKSVARIASSIPVRRSGILPSASFKHRQRGFRLARRLQRLAHDRIHVITSVDERHIAS
jgi:hypothetical protein